MVAALRARDPGLNVIAEEFTRGQSYLSDYSLATQFEQRARRCPCTAQLACTPIFRQL